MVKSRILVVDDNASLTSLVDHYLSKSGLYDVRVENRSSQALAAAQEFRPDLVLLDVDMPGKDGGAVAAQLAADRVLRHCPFIFFTSLISGSEAGQGEVMRGGWLYLAKPVEARVLLETVERVLRRGSPAVEARSRGQ